MQLLVPCLGFCLLIVKEFLFYFNLYLNFTRNVLSVILYSIVNRISCRLVTQLPLLYTVNTCLTLWNIFCFAFFTLVIQNLLSEPLNFLHNTQGIDITKLNAQCNKGYSHTNILSKVDFLQRRNKMKDKIHHLSIICRAFHFKVTHTFYKMCFNTSCCRF